ncbi:MAG: DUF4261 domain-containing protein [Polyangiaceae bacterium]|nr:DUF4261 domain-containing protein [Polyangiaceae bacterium]
MEPPESGPPAAPLALSMVLLRGDQAPSAAAVKASFERLFPELTVEESRADSNALFAFTGEDGVDWTFSHMPAPVPEADVRGALPLSPGLSDEAPVLAHATHLIVVSHGGELSALERRSHLSVGVAAAADASDAVAVFWSEGSVLHDVEAFVEEVRSQAIPVPLWFGLSVARPTEEDIELLTVGLRWLGHPDLLVSADLANADAAFGFVYDCVCYAIEEDHVLEAGESIGLGDEHALEIESIDSPIEPGVEVLKIRFEPPPS